MGYPEAQYTVDEVNATVKAEVDAAESAIRGDCTTINNNVNTTKNNVTTLINASKHGSKIFTSNGTFTVPSGIYKILVTACGGGGGGGGCLDSGHASGYSKLSYEAGTGGGGAAAIVRRAFSVTPGSNITITIGAGGAAGVNGTSNSNVTNGGDGGSTVVGSLITLPGGKGGCSSYNYKIPAAPGGDGGGYGGGRGGEYYGDYYDYAPTKPTLGAIAGIIGSPGALFEISGVGTPGGGSIGNGGSPARFDVACIPAGYGGGGGGGCRNSAGAGGGGIVIIEW